MANETRAKGRDGVVQCRRAARSWLDNADVASKCGKLLRSEIIKPMKATRLQNWTELKLYSSSYHYHFNVDQNNCTTFFPASLYLAIAGQGSVFHFGA